jgi:hypothetical protein
MNTRSSGWKLVAGAVVVAVLFAGVAHAQALTYVRSFAPAVTYGNVLSIAPCADGGFLTTGVYSVTKFSSTWSGQFEIANYTPGLTREPFYFPGTGAFQFPDGRLVVPDLYSNRLVVFDAAHNVVAHWPCTPGTTSSSAAKLADNGDFFLATNSGGVTTIRRWNSQGTLVKTWSLSTTACAIGLRGNALYLVGEALGHVYEFDFDGNLLGSFSTHTGPYVVGVAADDYGRIYVATSGAYAYAITVLAPDGATLETLTRAGSNPFTCTGDLLIRGSRLLMASCTIVHEWNIDAPVPTATQTWGHLKANYR